MNEECVTNGYAHNSGCHYTTGFFCEDCQTFFPKDSPTYIRYKLPLNLYMVINNIGVDLRQRGLDTAEGDRLMELLNKVSQLEPRETREDVLNAALLFIARHRKTPDSATLRL